MRTKSGQKGVILVAVGWLAVAPYVFAQDVTPPAPDKAPPDTKKTTDDEKDPVKVTVKGHKKPLKPADRDVYDVSQDPASQTGSVADTLNRIPGVVVDPTGKVSLHGKPVTILVDGHPSILLSGDNRAAALQAMPSSIIASVEVMTSPGAQYSSAGDGGVINIVTKHGLPAGGFGSLSANVQSFGGSGADAFGTYHVGKWTVQGSLYAQRGGAPTHQASTTTSTGAADLPSQTTQNEGELHAPYRSLNLSGTVGYELSKDDTLNLQGQFTRGPSRGWDRSNNSSSGASTRIYTEQTTQDGLYETRGLDLSWIHFGTRPDEKLTVEASLSNGTNTSRTDMLDHDLAPTPVDRTSSFSSGTKTQNAMLKADYQMPVGDDQLSLGGQISQDRNASTSVSALPDLITVTQAMSNITDSVFSYNQTVFAGYVLYQKEIGNWRLTGGLRSETLDLSSDFVTSRSTGHVVDTRVNPTVFISYVLSPQATFRLSYTRRLSRPDPQSLNPYLTLNSESSATAGNPHLKPQLTDKFEAQYDYARREVSFRAKGFYYKDNHTIASSSFVIPDPQGAGNQVIETTSTNFGFRETSGMEVSYSNRLGKSVSVNSDVTVQDIRLRGPDLTHILSATTTSASLSIGYSLPKQDQLFFMWRVPERIVSDQGIFTMPTTVMLSYGHQLTPKWSLNVNITDPLRMTKSTSVIETTNLHRLSVSSHPAPTFMISLSRNFSNFGK